MIVFYHKFSGSISPLKCSKIVKQNASYKQVFDVKKDNSGCHQSPELMLPHNQGVIVHKEIPVLMLKVDENR